MTDQNNERRIGGLVTRATKDIHGGESLLAMLQKAVDKAPEQLEAGGSNVGSSVGIRTPLINKDQSRQLRDFNATHSICLDAKKSSSTGLGHRDRKIHEVLDPLCIFSWQDTLDALSEDYWETGECFLEVVRAEGAEGPITGLHHIESAQVFIELEFEDRPELFHYLVEGETTGAEQMLMARWGEMDALRTRLGAAGEDPNANEAPRRVQTSSGTIVDSEVIHIRQATNRSKYLGYPDYMSAVPSIELVQCMTQHEFDFYFNRGVPEFMMFLIGNGLGDTCWDEVVSLIKGSQGIGNSHKTGAIQIPGHPDDVQVQIEKLAMEDAGNSGFSEKSGTLDMRICTAHGMPPQLANIALPGKIGGANEGPNAMLTFQMRKLGQAQKNFSGMFARTLGSDGVKLAQPSGGTASLTVDQFLAKDAKPLDDNDMPQFVQPGNGFNTILDGISLGAAETLNTMKEPIAGSGRSLEAGKLDGARDRKAGDPKATRKPAAGQ